MPIFVQWIWKERTKSYLVIFHFFDDYSKPNLRITKKKYRFMEHLHYPQNKAWMTWAPSHVELGLLGELLRYANIVDGLSETEKGKLRNVLEGKAFEDIWSLRNELPEDKIIFLDYEPVTGESIFVVELCIEYVDYLRKLLKPYIS